MALNKSIDCNNGVRGEYIKITEVYFNGITESANIVVSIYKDAATKNRGMVPLEVRKIHALKCQTPDVAFLYGALKGLPDYDGALDV